MSFDDIISFILVVPIMVVAIIFTIKTIKNGSWKINYWSKEGENKIAALVAHRGPVAEKNARVYLKAWKIKTIIELGLIGIALLIILIMFIFT